MNNYCDANQTTILFAIDIVSIKQFHLKFVFCLYRIFYLTIA